MSPSVLIGHREVNHQHISASTDQFFNQPLAINVEHRAHHRLAGCERCERSE